MSNESYVATDVEWAISEELVEDRLKDPEYLFKCAMFIYALQMGDRECDCFPDIGGIVHNIRRDMAYLSTSTYRDGKHNHPEGVEGLENDCKRCFLEYIAEHVDELWSEFMERSEYLDTLHEQAKEIVARKKQGAFAVLTSKEMEA